MDGATPPKDLLIVEDDTDIRETVAAILEGAGYAVATAENGKVALDYLHQAPAPKLILLDLMMPVCDGFAFCEAKDRDASIAQIPVVVVSAFVHSDARVGCINAVDRLSKPVDLDDLLNTVSRHIAH